MATAFEAEQNRRESQTPEERLAELEKRYETLSRQYEAEQSKRYGIAPEVAPAIDEEPEDEEPRFTLAQVEELLNSRLSALEEQLKEAKRTTGGGVANDDPGGGGGEPVPHHIHLEDGRIIQGHGGLGTHYSDESGEYRIVAAYPVRSNEEGK